jgi:hypothetical protein
MTKPEDVEHIARLLAKMENNDPDHPIYPPHVEPYQFNIMGGWVKSAAKGFAPVPLWHAYAEHAHNLLEAGLIDP